MKKQLRQERAAERLDEQLKSGVKTVKVGNKQTEVPLTESDIARIKGERATLKDRTGK